MSAVERSECPECGVGYRHALDCSVGGGRAMHTIRAIRYQVPPFGDLNMENAYIQGHCDALDAVVALLSGEEP